MDPGIPFSTFQNEASAALVNVTKTAVNLAAEDLPFHRSFDSAFASSLDQCSTTMLGLINSLLRNATTGTDLDAPKLGDVDDIETQWKDVVEVVDFLLEKADTCLDEYTGAIKQKNPQAGPNARSNARPNTRREDFMNMNPTKAGTPNMFRNRNLAKPQLEFRRKPNNHDTSPWKPIITSKPHAIVPLNDCLRSFMDDRLQMQYYHPYKTEIERLEYPSSVYESRPPIDYSPFDTTQATYIDSEASLKEMLKDLKQAKEIAIDLEHHSDHSYIGFVCLMQISTREKDWIVDTLKLREELQILNEVFTDPEIVKVLHGAYMDIIWLQRDFGLYVVGLFDTYQAARSLGFAGKGLAFLLKKYVDFDADKQYQQADWRIRPLPQEMLDYARSDTHFLLYCYDHVRNKLIENSTPDVDLIGETLSNSKDTSLRRYEREAYDLTDGSGQLGWALLLKRHPINFTSEQLAVFKAVHQWRDKVARDEDDSHHLVMPKHQLYNLGRLMPKDVRGIMSACHPVSKSVRLRINELLATIRTAKEEAQAEMPKPVSELEPTTAAIQTRKNIGIFDTDAKGSSRTEQSSFWGESLGSSKWLDNTVKLGKALADVRLAVPLPQLTAAIFINPNDPTPVTVKPQDPGSRVEHEFIRLRSENDPEDDIIVVKQLGGGRKRKRDKKGGSVGVATQTPTQTPAQNVEQVKTENRDGSAPQPQIIDDDGDDDYDYGDDDLVMVTGPPTTNQSEKDRKKKRKKKTKEPAAAADDIESAAAPKSKDSTPIQAFDYAKAPSVLKGADQNKERSAKAFNPYNKPGAGGPRGGKKGRREKEGKSMTFKK